MESSWGEVYHRVGGATVGESVLVVFIYYGRCQIGGESVKNKSNRLLVVGIVISFVLMMVGFFLGSIWFPIQDIDIMSEAELLAFRREFALNYSLGVMMYYVGIGVFIVCILSIIVDVLRRGRKKYD